MGLSVAVREDVLMASRGGDGTDSWPPMASRGVGPGVAPRADCHTIYITLMMTHRGDSVGPGFGK